MADWRAIMKSVAVLFVFLGLLVGVVWSQTRLPIGGSKAASWRDRVSGEAADRLIAVNPLNAELRELEMIVLPPKDTPRKSVERVYGQPVERNGKTGFYDYKLGDRIITIAYWQEKVQGAVFHHARLRYHETNLLNAPPGTKPAPPPVLSYTDLLFDLQRKVDDLGDALAVLQTRKISIPWHPWRGELPPSPPGE
jgi:hypothetical protein